MTQKIRVGHLRGLVMRAPGITDTLDFYTELWGLSAEIREGDTVYLHGTGDEPFIYGIKDADRHGIDYIHFGMDSRSDMDALYTQVRKLGEATLGEPSTFTDVIGGYGFEMLDPDNRRLRFTTDLKMRKPETVYGYPAEVSHVVLNTPDMAGGEAWYGRVLGFRTSDYSADQMVFMRCNRNHHSIALVRAQYASVNHVAFDMPGVDSFMRGIGRMKQLGHVPSWGPGRHGPGDNPFAYFVSPSGYVIEFTTDLLQLDESTHEAKVWSRTDPDSMDRWMTAGPPTPAMRTVMAGRPDPGFPIDGEA